MMVVASDQSMAVISGPGSGKTRVLTEKAKRLISEKKNILCLTFTKSAAKEMSDRVPNLPATTIHSYCCSHTGWDESWGYTGLLYKFLIMKDTPKFDWVLLDECQDTNEMELDVVLSLIGDKVFAVGDPYQSIYGFQGAMGMKAMEVLADVGCEVVDLHNNYRSCKSIVDKLNGIYDRKLVSRNVKKTGLTSILCRTNDDVIYISNLLKKSNIAHRLRMSAEHSNQRERDIVGLSNLRLMTIHVAKGQEFDKVLLYAHEWKMEEGEETRVYYVAVSRASKEFKEIDTLDQLLEEVTE